MFQDYQVSYAGFWWRVLASLIDGVIIGAVFLPLGIGLGFGIGASGADPDSVWMPAVNLGLNGFQILVSWLYCAILESSSWQGTVGKKVCGLRVTDLAGNRISFGRATGRHFGMILSVIICYVGLIMVAFTEKKQGLHDIMANTLVLKGPAVPNYVAPPPPPDFNYRGGGPLNI
ncbi:MAG TPA: RDD family protein [Pyrinomonadaceae bacterium]|nr:RDD family protein [Pyrinomonadaceae bacterium]